ncbi:MAG: glycosyltransferase family 39 protein [Candidatus Levybacteria bacterium]|nr:glycosyltransferase family 39 protein [Candidatus Levybacteria bacterium]
MGNKKYLFFLGFIIIIAAFLRLYNLSNVPPGVNRDEASIGYTAYSLILTGKDEYGHSFPISFQSFGDWKLPFYIYTTAISVKLFGLSEFAVRFPSALFGIATVGLTYFLVLELFGTREKTLRFFSGQAQEKIALLTSFLLAISPWALHLSRVESESNTAVFLTVCGLFLFLKSIKNKHWFILPSLVLFALTYYTYAGNHIFTTLFVVGLFLLYKSEIIKNKWSYISIALFIALSGFIFYHTLFRADKTKISGISIFGDPAVLHSKVELLRDEHSSQSPVAKAFHNPLSFGAERFFQNYLNAFSPDFLFIKGGTNSAHNIENFGNMYLVESIFLLFGLSYLLISKKGKEEKLILFWLFISPIAASITKDAPHTNRMFAIFPILPLICAIGIYWFVTQLKNNKLLKNVSIFIFGFLFFINFSIYMDRYYIHFPKEEAQSWGLGYKELNNILSQKGLKNKRVIISKPEESPYIFLLFYSKYDPAKYQKEAVRYPPTSDGFVNVKSFGRFEFRHIDWSKEIKIPNQLLVDDSLMISEFTKKQQFSTQEVIFPNKKVMFSVLEIDNRKIIE